MLFCLCLCSLLGSQDRFLSARQSSPVPPPAAGGSISPSPLNNPHHHRPKWQAPTFRNPSWLYLPHQQNSCLFTFTCRLYNNWWHSINNLFYTFNKWLITHIVGKCVVCQQLKLLQWAPVCGSLWINNEWITSAKQLSFHTCLFRPVNFTSSRVLLFFISPNKMKWNQTCVYFNAWISILRSAIGHAGSLSHG